MSLLKLFCDVDDFWQRFSPIWEQEQLTTGALRRRRAGKLSPSEIMAILIHFHQSHYRDFKFYYTQHVQVILRHEFPHQVSYGRFVKLIPRTPLCAYLVSRYGQCTSISFIDSTPIAVCHSQCATTDASTATESSRVWQNEVAFRWTGSLASSSTS